MYNLIDTHFHLDFYKNHDDIYHYFNDRKIYVLCVTNQPEVFETCVNMYGLSKYVKFAIGYNPKLVGDVPFSINAFDRNIVKTDYIGEVGLDFKTTNLNYKEKQLEIFNYISNVAAKTNKLMTVHCYRAEEEIFATLKQNGNRKVIIHWYTGDIKWAEKLIELGCFFSVNMNMLMNNKTIDIIKKIPKTRLLIESDGPFSKINGKGYIPEKLEDIYTLLAATIKETDITKLVFDNFKTLLLLNK